MHLDITVSDLETASARAQELGARVLGPPVDEDDSTFQVHADPSGHPFCFCRDK
jgi:predicted enzyme related to lactoylglutathione lyase